MAEPVKLNITALKERPQYDNVLVYGESGVGKTTFAASAPRPILWLDTEGGTNVISDPTDIFVVQMTGLEDYREAVRYVRANPGKFKTVVIDSWTETQALLLKEIMREVVRQDPGRDEHAPKFAEWGKITNVMREIARAFRDLDTHLIVTALTREDTDEMTGRTKVRPRMTPALAEELPGFMDVCGYMYAVTPSKGEVGGGKAAKTEEEAQADSEVPTEDGYVRNMLLKPTGKYAAKARIPKGKPQPDFISDPTFEALHDLLH